MDWLLFGWRFSGSRIRCGKQSIGGTVKPLHRTFRVIEMTDQFTGRAIDVDPLEIIKLVAGRIENLRTDHNANEDALTVEYVAAHDQASLQLGTPRTLRFLAENSERNRIRVGLAEIDIPDISLEGPGATQLTREVLEI
jgi:hypothetical protein